MFLVTSNNGFLCISLRFLHVWNKYLWSILAPSHYLLRASYYLFICLSHFIWSTLLLFSSIAFLQITHSSIKTSHTYIQNIPILSTSLHNIACIQFAYVLLSIFSIHLKNSINLFLMLPSWRELSSLWVSFYLSLSVLLSAVSRWRGFIGAHKRSELVKSFSGFWWRKIYKKKQLLQHTFGSTLWMWRLIWGKYRERKSRLADQMDVNLMRTSPTSLNN